MVSFFSFGNKFKFNSNTNKVVISNNSLLNTNSAAIGAAAFWNGGLNFNSVGTNGKSSSYGTFDQTGLAWEWCDANSTSNTYKVIRGGDISNTGGIANYYNSDKSKRYLKTTTGGDTNPVSFVTSPNRNKGKPQDQDWSGRIVSISNPLSLNNYVTIGNTNNSSDTNGYGSVSYSYQISKYLLTNDEYCAFLNLKAVSDPNQLYATQMSTERVGGIVRSGVSGSYSYSVKTNMGNKPVYFLSWFSLARYCNWLHNGMGSGSTETGAYTLNNALTGIINKNVGANYYIPNENEWYKAAYYKGGSSNAGYWKFATQSDSIPQIVASTLNGDGTIRNVSIKPVNTIGSNVSVTGINDSIYNVGISINYAQISSSGVTKVTPVTLNDPKLPVNFSLSNSLGKYNISTTSSRSGNIDICFTLPSTISLSTFNKTKVFHTSSGITTNVTITTGANAPNFSNKTICARVSNFSDFHIIPENDNFNYAIPSNVSGSVSNGSVNLNWNMSDTTDIFDYSIKYSSDSGNSWSEYNHLPNSGLSLVVDGLTNNTSYLFSVAAIGLSGIGNYSSYSSSLTPVASVPDIVTGLSGSPNINSVDLIWNVPNNNGSNIINYSVQYSSDSGSTWISSNDPLYLFADDVSTTRNLTVTNLNSSNSYIFRISAINSIGSGNYSSYSNSIIPLSNIPNCDLVISDTITISATPTATPSPTPTNTPAPKFTPMSVLLTTGNTYTVPSGATTMKAWAVGGGGKNVGGGGGGCAYKTWSVTSGQTISYTVPSARTTTNGNGGSATVTASGVTITGGGGGGVGYFQPGGGFSGGDGGANGGSGGSVEGGSYGGAVGGNSVTASCGRRTMTDVSGLKAALSLAGVNTTETCGSTAAFGSGAYGSKYANPSLLSPGLGGGAGEENYGHTNSGAGGGAVVLYFT